MTSSINVEMEDMICGTCSVVFAMPKNLYQNRLDKGGTFFCPNGHELLFRETTVAKLQKQLSAATTREQAEREQRLAAEAERDRLKQRTLKNGVCPCCKRNFSALSRHMKTKHPDYIGK
jgi:hypothetical protein